MGEVANRRAWFDVTKLTPEVLQLYKQPLKVQGWDLALLEVSPACVLLYCVCELNAVIAMLHADRTVSDDALCEPEACSAYNLC